MQREEGLTVVDSNNDKNSKIEKSLVNFIKGFENTNSGKMNSFMKFSSIKKTSGDSGSFEKLVNANNSYSKISDFSATDDTVQNILSKDYGYIFDSVNSGSRRRNKRRIVQEFNENDKVCMEELLNEFECSMEEDNDKESAVLPVKDQIIFLNSKSKTLAKRSNYELELNSIILFGEKDIGKEKDYHCDLCDKIFLSHASLGGHTSKNHPNSSESFTRRRKTYTLRQY